MLNFLNSSWVMYIAMTLLAIMVGWWVFIEDTGSIPSPDELPPKPSDTVVVLPDVPKIPDGEEKSDCKAIIDQYDFLVFQREVLQVNEVTEALEERYRKCMSE